MDLAKLPRRRVQNELLGGRTSVASVTEAAPVNTAQRDCTLEQNLISLNCGTTMGRELGCIDDFFVFFRAPLKVFLNFSISVRSSFARRRGGRAGPSADSTAAGEGRDRSRDRSRKRVPLLVFLLAPCTNFEYSTEQD